MEPTHQTPLRPSVEVLIMEEIQTLQHCVDLAAGRIQIIFTLEDYQFSCKHVKRPWLEPDEQPVRLLIVGELKRMCETLTRDQWRQYLYGILPNITATRALN